MEESRHGRKEQSVVWGIGKRENGLQGLYGKHPQAFGGLLR